MQLVTNSPMTLLGFQIIQKIIFTLLFLLSVIDVIEVLTGSAIPKRYWSDLKKKLLYERSQLYENIVQLKMQSADGKFYLTDVADTLSEVLQVPEMDNKISIIRHLPR